MKRINKKTVVLVLVLTTAAALVSFADSGDFGAKGAEGKTGLSIDQMLTYAIQDEYLARAEYDHIMEEYGNIRPFTNIIAAEVRHIEWVTELLQKYSFAVPKDSAAVWRSTKAGRLDCASDRSGYNSSRTERWWKVDGSLAWPGRWRRELEGGGRPRLCRIALLPLVAAPSRTGRRAGRTAGRSARCRRPGGHHDGRAGRLLDHNLPVC